MVDLCGSACGRRRSRERRPSRADKPITYDEPCVRAHVALDANQSAGGKYGALVKSARIPDAEKHNVSVVD